MTDQDAISIRSVDASDFDAIARIYNHYIINTVVTFEVEEVTAAEMLNRMRVVQSDSLPWIVAVEADEVVGYSYASKWHARYAYRFSAETTVYLDHNHGGRGIGSKLYQRLLELVVEQGMRTVIGGIAIPNAASVALHEKFGYRRTAYYKEVGFKFDRWIDVGYWQLMLESRRS